jgi:uncharacterized protein (TIRG00374 family)
MRKVFLLFLQSILGIVLLFIFIRSVDFSQFFSYLSRVSLFFTLLAGGFYLLGAFLRVIRFRYLFFSLKLISFQDALTSSFAGALLNYLIPLRAGEVGRAWYLKRLYGVSLVSATTVSFIDKLFDLFAVFIIVIFSFPAVKKLASFQFISGVQILLFVAVLICLFVFVFHGKVLLAYSHRLFRSFPFLHPILVLFERLLVGFSVLHIRPFYFVGLLFLSLLALVADGLFVYFLYLAFGFFSSLWIPILGYAIFSFSFMIPAGPGYVGNIELLGVLVFSNLLGLPKEISVSVIVYLHLLITLLLFVLGIPSFYFLHLRKIKRFF